MDCATVYVLTQSLANLPPDEYWLSAGERERVDGFRFPKRRRDWLLGRWTAKMALRSYLVRTGQQVPDYPALEIRSAADGAPEAYWNGQPGSVSLTLSHSGDQGFCAVSLAGAALGCDLEAVQARDLSFFADYFCDEENSWLAQAGLAEQPLLATLIWSAKESALKCLREGLRRDTRSVLVSPAPVRKLGWNSMTVHCLESSREFYGWWRSVGSSVQTVAASMKIKEPVELSP